SRASRRRRGRPIRRRRWCPSRAPERCRRRKAAAARRRACQEQNAPGKTADAELQAFHVVEGLDLLAEPAAHLTRRVARRHAPAVIGLEEVVEQLHPAALELPGFLLA